MKGYASWRKSKWINPERYLRSFQSCGGGTHVPTRFIEQSGLSLWVDAGSSRSNHYLLSIYYLLGTQSTYCKCSPTLGKPFQVDLVIPVLENWGLEGMNDVLKVLQLAYEDQGLKYRITWFQDWLWSSFSPPLHHPQSDIPRKRKHGGSLENHSDIGTVLIKL